MEWVEITANTVEAAKEKALEQLGVAEGDAEIQVVQEPKTGLFGRVRQEARVRARVQPSSPRPKRSRGGGKSRNEGQRGQKPRAEGQGGQRSPKPKAEKQQGGRQEGGRNADRKAAGAAAVSSVAPAGGASRNKEEDEMADGVTLEEQAAVAKEFLVGLIEVMDLEATVEIRTLDDETVESIVCDINVNAVSALAAIKAAVIRKADGFMQQCSTMAYAFIRHPWAPINWGTGAYQNFLTQVAQAYTLTGDRKYLYWMVRTFDNTLGANPLCRSYIVGAGERTVRAPLHNSRYSSSGEVVEGMQVQGPVQSGEGYRIKETAYPKIRDEFACLYTFVDNHFAISMNEGVVTTEAQTLAMLGLMLPDHK